MSDRTRERYPSVASTPNWTVYNDYYSNANDSTYTSRTTYPGTGVAGTGTHEVTTDVVTPNFAARVAQGEIINNPLTHTVTSDIWPGVVSFNWKGKAPSGSGASWNGTRDPILLGVNFFYDSNYNAACDAAKQAVIDIAVTQAFANIDESEILAFATAAESRKTVDSMQAILRRLYAIMKAVRRLDVAALGKQLSPKELADRYMEARYAIRPLIYDAAGVLNALDKSTENCRRTYRGFAKDSVSLSLVNSVTGHLALPGIHYKLSEERTYAVSARAGVLCDVDITGLTVYGIDKLAESLWEIVPFSFIVDWFANVGDTIAALTPNAGVKQLASWVTVKETRRSRHTYHSPSQSDNYYTQMVLNCPSEIVREWVQRVTTRTTDPQVSIFPTSRMRLDSYKLGDLAIILRQVLS